MQDFDDCIDDNLIYFRRVNVMSAWPRGNTTLLNDLFQNFGDRMNQTNKP